MGLGARVGAPLKSLRESNHMFPWYKSSASSTRLTQLQLWPIFLKGGRNVKDNMKYNLALERDRQDSCLSRPCSQGTICSFLESAR